MNHEAISLKFDAVAETQVGDVKKFSGLIQAKHLLPLIDELDLEANPRASRVGAVTKAIRESIDTEPMTFPFKTKGLLLGTTRYERDANRVRAWFEERRVEGILDGGHNTLAIATHVLDAALDDDGKTVKKIKTWNDLREAWNASAEELSLLKQKVQQGESAELDFKVPVELIVPSDSHDKLVVESFRETLLDICAARNNNAALKEAAKANQAGYFEELRNALDPKIASLIEWKTNDGGSIKVEDIVALAWIPLSVIPTLPNDAKGVRIEKPAPQVSYSGKGKILAQFNRLMESDEVTGHELRNPTVHSALMLTADLPALYDYIQLNFPAAYNANGGRYLALAQVKNMNKSGKSKPSKYTAQKQDIANPEGFIAPLVWGLQALMTFENDKVVWKTDPKQFLAKHLTAVVADFANIINFSNADPQRVGKAPVSYQTVLNSYKLALQEDQ